MNIGTDCSGIEAPIQALKQLKIPHNHLFSSDINKYARQSIKANYDPEILFEDMTKDRELPKLDVYVCGFPCQPFSIAGQRLASSDPRGNIFLHCVKTIKQTDPSLFILENVKGILTAEGGNYMKTIKLELEKLDYNVLYWVLNTKDYGIPQNRERLYIIGTKGRIPNIPEKIKCNPIESYIDTSVTEKEEYCNTYKRVYEQFKDGTFTTPGSLRPNKYKINPTCSSTIISSCPLWCIPMQRKATIKECLSLQGFPTDFKQVVSDTQMRKQIGNSMSVNVLMEIFKECLV